MGPQVQFGTVVGLVPLGGGPSAGGLVPPAGVLPAGGRFATILDGNLDTLALLVLFFVLGLYLVYDGARTYRTSRYVANTPTEKARSVAVGRTEVTGTASEAGTTYDRPFTGGECVYRDWEVEEFTYDHDDDLEKEWQTVDRGRDVAPFYVEDDTGRVLVDAEAGATFEISPTNTTEITLDEGEALPAEVRSFYGIDDGGETRSRDRDSGDGSSMFESVERTVAEAVPDAGERALPDPDNERRFSEEVLPVDEEVYVFGGATPREDATGSNAERLAIRTDGSTGRFLVSDRDERGIVKYYSRRGPLQALLGLGMSALTLYLLLHDYVMV